MAALFVLSRVYRDLVLFFTCRTRGLPEYGGHLAVFATQGIVLYNVQTAYSSSSFVVLLFF